MLRRLWLLVGSDRPRDRQCHLLSCPGQLINRYYIIGGHVYSTLRVFIRCVCVMSYIWRMLKMFLRIFPLDASAMACLRESEWYFNRPGKPRWKRMDDWFLENLSKGMQMARLQIWEINSVVRRYLHSKKVGYNCVFERAVVLGNGNLKEKGLSGKTCCTQVGPAAPQLLEMQRFEVLFEHRLHFLYHPIFIFPLL